MHDGSLISKKCAELARRKEHIIGFFKAINFGCARGVKDNLTDA